MVDERRGCTYGLLRRRGRGALLLGLRAAHACLGAAGVSNAGRWSERAGRGCGLVGDAQTGAGCRGAQSVPGRAGKPSVGKSASGHKHSGDCKIRQYPATSAQTPSSSEPQPSHYSFPSFTEKFRAWRKVARRALEAAGRATRSNGGWLVFAPSASKDFRRGVHERHSLQSSTVRACDGQTSGGGRARGDGDC